MALLTARRRPSSAAPAAVAAAPKADSRLAILLAYADKMLASTRREIEFHKAEAANENNVYDGDIEPALHRSKVWSEIRTKRVSEFYGETTSEEWQSADELKSHVRAKAAQANATNTMHPLEAHAWRRAEILLPGMDD